MGKELRLKAVQWREKRSKDANNYHWELLGQLAVKLYTTPDELHEHYLQMLSLVDTFNGNHITVTLPSFLDPKKALDEKTHWKKIRESADGKFIAWLKLKGSSQMDSAEMSRLIDLVVEDCEENGIDTATPAEKERMLKLWQQRAG